MIKKDLLTFVSALLLSYVSAQAAEGEFTVVRNDALPSSVPPEKVVAGNIRHDNLFAATAEAPYSMNFVTFEPGSRTAWHQHPDGMRAVILSGIGLLGTEDEVITLFPGDAIYCPPGKIHWHGASADKAMTHLSVTYQQNGVGAVWGEKVTDKEFRGEK